MSVSPCDSDRLTRLAGSVCGAAGVKGDRVLLLFFQGDIQWRSPGGVFRLLGWINVRLELHSGILTTVRDLDRRDRTSSTDFIPLILYHGQWMRITPELAPNPTLYTGWV